MNLALLVSTHTREDIAAFIAKTAELQTTKVNGAVVVAHDFALPKAQVAALIAPLSGLFQVVTALPVMTNRNLTPAAQTAGLFSKFLLACYARFPGPWLVVDDFALPTRPDFMQALDRQHASFATGMTGRGVTGKGWLVPVGPVVLSLPGSVLKFLRFATTENWRQRGMYQFARVRFGMVKPEDYLFTISDKPVELPPEATPAPPAFTRETLPKPFIADEDAPPVPPASTQPSFAEINALPLPERLEAFAELAPPPRYQDMDRPALIALLTERGAKPHPQLGHAKLVMALKALDPQPA